MFKWKEQYSISFKSELIDIDIILLQCSFSEISILTPWKVIENSKGRRGGGGGGSQTQNFFFLGGDPD